MTRWDVLNNWLWDVAIPVLLVVISILVLALSCACSGPVLVEETPEPPETGVRIVGTIETWVDGVLTAVVEGGCSAGIWFLKCGGEAQLVPEDSEGNP